MDELSITVAGEGRLVVLVHGTAPATWGTVPTLLAGECRVLTYDRRGFPPSAGEPGATLRAHAEDLRAVVEAHGRSATIVGWSIGGVIALDLALRRPDLVDRVVVLEAPLWAARRPTLALLRAVLGAQLRGRRSPEAGARHFLSWALGRRSGGDDVARLDSKRLSESSRSITKELGVGTGEKELRPKDLALLPVPVRWLVGTESAPEFGAAARRARAALPAIDVVSVPGAGHAIQLDAPDSIVAAVLG